VVHVHDDRAPGAQRDRCGFAFAGGRIAIHRDTFDFWRWSRMALGLKGALFGATPLVRKAVRVQARKSLDGWMAQQRSR
jgi:hypothetical protein